jgi:hypothetical protein
MTQAGGGAQPLYATLSPNPGGESNFFYTGTDDELTVENLNVDGNLVVTGTLNGGSGDFLEASVSDVKTGGELRFQNDLQIAFGSSIGGALLYASADAEVQLNMDVGIDYTIRDNGTLRFTFDMGTGNFTSTGDINAQSDVRTKTNIETITDALNKVLSMRGVTYERKAELGNVKLGVIAQEVEEILPEVINTTDDGMKAVAYGNIVGLLIEAIKDLKEEVDNLNQ